MQGRLGLVVAVSAGLASGACGAARSAASGMVNLATGVANAQLADDLRHNPYMACPMDTTALALVRAMERSFPEAGYTVAAVEADQVRARPSVARRTGSQWYLEVLTGYVVLRGDTSVVWLQYQAGLSTSETTILTPPGAEPARVGYDRKYYRDIMASVARRVGRPSCEP